MSVGSVALRIGITNAPEVGAVEAKLIGRVCEFAVFDGDIPDPIVPAWPNAGVIAALARASAMKLRRIEGLSFL
jgi:hypothetical protein